MRENRQSGSEGGVVQTNAPSLPLWGERDARFSLGARFAAGISVGRGWGAGALGRR
jgi:hypothetical protein